MHRQRMGMGTDSERSALQRLAGRVGNLSSRIFPNHFGLMDADSGAHPEPQNGEKLPHTQSESVTGDRKSTRLNSSHANISYAVFCLKKKTTLSHAIIVSLHSPYLPCPLGSASYALYQSCGPSKPHIQLIVLYF